MQWSNTFCAMSGSLASRPSSATISGKAAMKAGNLLGSTRLANISKRSLDSRNLSELFHGPCMTLKATSINNIHLYRPQSLIVCCSLFHDEWLMSQIAVMIKQRTLHMKLVAHVFGDAPSRQMFIHGQSKGFGLSLSNGGILKRFKSSPIALREQSQRRIELWLATLCNFLGLHSFSSSGSSPLCRFNHATSLATVASTPSKSDS